MTHVNYRKGIQFNFNKMKGVKI